MGVRRSCFLLCSVGFAAAAQSPAEPFKPVPNDKATETTASQSKRLRTIRDLATTESIHLLRMDQSVPIGEKLKITVPEDHKTFLLTKTGGETHDEKDFVWFGTVQGEPPGSATLVARNGEVSGSINSALGAYRLTPLGDGLYALVKVNEQKLPPVEPPSKHVNRQ